MPAPRAPINFNGLVRQYYLRAGGEVGDIQVNLVDKHHRSEQSHAIATRVRPALQTDRPALQRQRQGRRSAAGSAGAGAHRRRDLRAGGRGPPRGRQGRARGVRQDRGRRRRRRQQHCRGAEDAAARRPPQGGDAGRAAGGHRQHLAGRPGRRGDELPARRDQISGRGDAAAAGRAAGRPRYAAATRRALAPRASWCRFANWSP